jgi:flagellar FliL protein
MAKVDEDLDLDVESGKKKGGGKMKSIIIFSVIGILLIGLSITLTLVLIGGDKEAAPGSAQHAEESATESQKKTDEAAAASGDSVAYLDLSPAFVVNLDGKESDVRYLQINMSVMVAQEGDLEMVKTHMPVLRHHLNMLFSSLDFNDISDREGKNKLTDETLKVVQDALQEAAGKSLVKAVYFNSIVGQ